MTPPKATPDTKGKVCKPTIISTDMPRIGQNIFVGVALERFIKEMSVILKEYEQTAQK